MNATTSIAFVMGPDDVKVELLENKQQTMPIALHHVHFFGPQNTEMRAWYEKVFGAKPRAAGGTFLVADLPGVALNFSPSPDPVIGTTGRSIEHIGFEVKDLEGFCKKLEAMGIKLNVTYRKSEAFGLGIAFVTDPWGTSIELNEGLDKIAVKAGSTEARPALRQSATGSCGWRSSSPSSPTSIASASRSPRRSSWQDLGLSTSCR